MEIIAVSENDELSISVERLLFNGELALDSRIEKRGYFTVALAAGRLSLRATRFVGLIPLTANIAVRVTPKVTISNLAMMMVKAGNVPAVIENFSRGYLPSFNPSAKSFETYHGSFIAAMERLLRLGIMQGYVRLEPAPAWRGRLLVTETVNRQVAHGVRYKPVFDFHTFSADVPQNRALKYALIAVLRWLRASSDKKIGSQIPRVLNQLKHLDGISVEAGAAASLTLNIPRLASTLPPQHRHYGEALWLAYAILQGELPDPTHYGCVSLDSMIIDVSLVFEGYIRNLLASHPEIGGLEVKDGNVPANKCSFFSDPFEKTMKPDIIVERAGKAVAIADVKYKNALTEHDRYELLSFMEATGASVGIFVLPKATTTDASMRMGTTLGGKHMSSVRFDLSAADMHSEELKFAKSIRRILDGHLP